MLRLFDSFSDPVFMALFVLGSLVAGVLLAWFLRQRQGADAQTFSLWQIVAIASGTLLCGLLSWLPVWLLFGGSSGPVGGTSITEAFTALSCVLPLALIVGMFLGAWLVYKLLLRRSKEGEITVWQIVGISAGMVVGGVIVWLPVWLLLGGGSGPIDGTSIADSFTPVRCVLPFVLLLGMFLGAWLAYKLLLRGSKEGEITVWQIVGIGAGMIVGGVLVSNCGLLWNPVKIGSVTATPAPTQTSTVATVTPQTPPTDTPIPPPTTVPATIAPTLPPIPQTFSVLLQASDQEPSCGNEGFAYNYNFEIDGEALTLTQVEGNHVTPGTYNPETHEFSAEQGGFPGTQRYWGELIWDGKQIIVEGFYTYADDPNFCEGVWKLFGETTP